jgi:hypothetical protein
MKAVSIWAANAQAELPNAEPILIEAKEFKLTARLISDSLWLEYEWAHGERISFRTAFSPSGKLEINHVKNLEKETHISLSCSTLDFNVRVSLSNNDLSFEYEVIATPKIPLFIPYWPKDILCFTKNGTIKQNGTILTKQVGTRSGVLFFNDGNSGSVFYFQNLTALNTYFEATQTSGGDLVGGEWPEIGFFLPPTVKPLEKDKAYTFSHAFVRLDSAVLEDTSAISTSYLDHLAETYIKIPRPERHYHNWLDTVENGLKDLIYHKGCWTFVGGRTYLNAYVADYKSPPEVMVQLAVLMPMLDYLEWKGDSNHQLINEIRGGLPAFYQEDMKTIVRWLPAAEKDLDHSEEQKKPRVMDSWYLHHPLMNLARLTERGDEIAKKLLFDSIDYCIKVAQHFKYEWPVFYQMDTLKVIKEETAEGAGGEKDVPGTYADLMLRLWKITGEQKYLKEAVKASKKLKGLGFNIFYQANNTAYTACAMLNLYKETKDETYLNLSYDCLAAIFNNVQLWECDYGHAKNFTTFFGVFPLKDAPYTAAYEEQEVYSALYYYLQEAEGIKIKPSVKLLVAEFIRHMLGRVVYYYPPMLKDEMLVKESKTGEIDPKLWIAVEDLQDGWKPSGEVGQEVYGAGIAFGVIPKQYFKIKDESFTLFCDYPIHEFKNSKKKISFRTAGDVRLNCRIILLLGDQKSKYTFETKVGKDTIKPVKQRKELIEFNVTGDQKIKLTWR